jgi:hypothetical protein
MLVAAKALFKKYPMASNAVVYGTLITGAEFSQQTITKKILVSCKHLNNNNNDDDDYDDFGFVLIICM